jgi:3-(3-hydroxy-phenyl)propionate hydroxylase
MLKTYTYPKFDYVRPPSWRSSTAGHYPVVVVGAGPVGLSWAIDLAAQGQPVVVLDNDDTVSIGSRGVCYAKRALEIWDRLGCGSPWWTRACPGTWAALLGEGEVFQFNLLPEAGHNRPGIINLQQYYPRPTWSSARAAAQPRDALQEQGHRRGAGDHRPPCASKRPTAPTR